MRNDVEYYSAVSLMMQGVSPAEIAEQLDISRSTVVRWHSEFKRHKDAGTLDKLVSLSDLAIVEAACNVELPELIQEAKLKVSGLQVLDMTLQNTALNLANRINSMAMSASGSDELVTLTDALCKLQNAFFNSNKVQVNVQNNIGGEGGKTYSAFMGDKPGA